MRSKMPHVSNAKVRTRTPTSIPDKSLEMLLPRGQRDPSTKVFLPPKVPQKLHGFCLVLYPFYPPLTASKFATEKRPFLPRKGSSSNFQPSIFRGENVSFREGKPTNSTQFVCFMWWQIIMIFPMATKWGGLPSHEGIIITLRFRSTSRHKIVALFFPGSTHILRISKPSKI